MIYKIKKFYVEKDKSLRKSNSRLEGLAFHH